MVVKGDWVKIGTCSIQEVDLLYIACSLSNMAQNKHNSFVIPI